MTQVDKVRKSQPGNLCAKHLDKAYYKSLEGEDRDTFYKCVKTGIDNPDSGMGCYAMTPAGEDRAFELAATNPPRPPASTFHAFCSPAIVRNPSGAAEPAAAAV